MKSKKTSVWVALALTAAFIIAGVVFLLLPNNSPLKVEAGSIKTSYSSNNVIYIYGRLTNTTGEDLEITYMEVIVTTSEEKITVYDDEPFVIASGETYDLYEDDWGAIPDYYPANITISDITVTVDGVKYTVYENMPAYTVAAIAMIIFAVIFAVLTLTMFLNARKMQKRYDEMNATLANMSGDGILLGGVYTQKNAAGKNAAKTAASVAVGAVSAAFLGVGVYKVYGGNTQREFIVTDNGLYIGVPSKNPINFAEMNFIPKGKFGDCEVTVKKKNVILTNNTTNETFIFDTANSTANTEQFADRLRALIAYVPESATNETEAPPPADPFE